MLMKSDYVYMHCLPADLCGKLLISSSTRVGCWTGNDALLCIYGETRTLSIGDSKFLLFFKEKQLTTE